MKDAFAVPTKLVTVSTGIGLEHECTGKPADWSLEHKIDCLGSSAFGRLAASVGNDPRKLLARYGVDGGEYGPRLLASFSAGHGLVNPMFAASSFATDNLGYFRACLLADSYYTGKPGIKQGIADYARGAVEGRRIFIATVSSFAGARTDSSAACIAPLVELLGLEARKFAWPFEPAPVRVWTKGKAMVADFGDVATHGQHATVIAPKLMRWWISKYLSLSFLTITDEPAPWEGVPEGFLGRTFELMDAIKLVGMFGGSVAAGYWATKAIRRQYRDIDRETR